MWDNISPTTKSAPVQGESAPVQGESALVTEESALVRLSLIDKLSPNIKEKLKEYSGRVMKKNMEDFICELCDENDFSISPSCGIYTPALLLL